MTPITRPIHLRRRSAPRMSILISRSSWSKTAARFMRYPCSSYVSSAFRNATSTRSRNVGGQQRRRLRHECLQSLVGARHVAAVDRGDEADQRAVAAVMQDGVLEQSRLRHILICLMPAALDKPEIDQLLVGSLADD